MAKSIRLLLTENVDNLGIVGDVVNVRLGYARNFLLPRNLATVPSEDIIASLAAKRKDAEAQQKALRSSREELIAKINGLEITLERSCNDQGQLYGSVTQQDIANALTELGYSVRGREVRLSHTIKRIDHYDVLIKFDTDLEAHIQVWVAADRHIEEDDREEMEFDNEGNLIEKKPKAKAVDAPAEETQPEPAEA
ncbi:MAG: 50S ribosomal protein L9 [Planctomycetota bacterium]